MQLEREESSWLCDWLDTVDPSPATLLRWLDGMDLPDDSASPPHRTLLDLLPLRRQSLPRYVERLSSVAAQLLDELTARGGYPPEEISHQALSELFYLCACLATPELLADPLAVYHAAMAARGPGSLDETPRYALRLALERNQADGRLGPAWVSMIGGKEIFLLGSWADAFGALGRAFNAALLGGSLLLSDKRAANLLSPQYVSLFRAALLGAQDRLLQEQPDVEQAGEKLNALLTRWEQVCPALRSSLPTLILNVCYQPGLTDWMGRVLDHRLRLQKASLSDLIRSVARQRFTDGSEVERLISRLQTEVERALDDHCLSLITEARLRNVIIAVLQQHGYSNGMVPAVAGSACSKFELVGCYAG